MCDKNSAPTGPSTTAVPRPKIGTVPYGSPILSCVQDGVAALTFDDGPSSSTRELLRLLKANGFKATFFVIGVNIERSADDEAIIKQIVADGHQLASHSFTHPDMSLINSGQRKRELFYTETIFGRVLNKIPTYFRAPFLSCDGACQQDVGDLGYHLISTNLETKDFATPDDMTTPKRIITEELAGIGAQSSSADAPGKVERRAPAEPLPSGPLFANATAITNGTFSGPTSVVSSLGGPTAIAEPIGLNSSARAQQRVGAPLGILSLQHDTVQKTVTELTPFFIGLLKQRGLRSEFTQDWNL